MKKEQTSRNTTIDFLRGLAVILMILIHTTAYFWHDPFAYLIWDYTHIVVPLFIFCSSYIVFKRGQSTPIMFSSLWKRIKRLVIPYYIFLIPLFIFISFHDPASLTFNKIMTKVLLGSGRDLTWLIILFIYLIFLVPLINHLYHKKTILFWIYAAIALISSLLFLNYSPGIPFRYLMWLPWSVFLIFTLWYAVFEKTTWFTPAALLLSSALFAITRIYLAANGHTLVFTENKYPPNLYYLSYGIFFTIVLASLHQKLSTTGLLTNTVQRGIDFCSIHSYSLFFIHFLYVLVFVDVIDYQRLTWGGFFIAILGLSIVTQIALTNLISVISTRLPTSK